MPCECIEAIPPTIDSLVAADPQAAASAAAKLCEVKNGKRCDGSFACDVPGCERKEGSLTLLTNCGCCGLLVLCAACAVSFGGVFARANVERLDTSQQPLCAACLLTRSGSYAAAGEAISEDQEAALMQVHLACRGQRNKLVNGAFEARLQVCLQALRIINPAFFTSSQQRRGGELQPPLGAPPPPEHSAPRAPSPTDEDRPPSPAARSPAGLPSPRGEGGQSPSQDARAQEPQGGAPLPERKPTPAREQTPAHEPSLVPAPMPALAPAPSPEACAAALPRAMRFEPGTLVQHRSLNRVYGSILSTGEDGLSISVWPTFEGFKYIGEHPQEVKKFPYDEIVLLSENPLASPSSGRSAACYGSRLHTVCKSDQGCYAVGMQRPGFPNMSLGDPVEINIAEYEHPALRADLRHVLAGFVKRGRRRGRVPGLLCC